MTLSHGQYISHNTSTQWGRSVSTREPSTQLARIVEEAIEEHNLEQFAEYWELYKSVVHVQNIEGFFVRTEPNLYPYGSGGYCNVAIIADGLLIDIEGDDSDDTGNLSFHPLESVSGVRIRPGPLHGLEASREALLVVIANRVGEDGIGLYWVAETEEAEEDLRQFVRILLKAISKDGS